MYAVIKSTPQGSFLNFKLISQVVIVIGNDLEAFAHTQKLIADQQQRLPSPFRKRYSKVRQIFVSHLALEFLISSQHRRLSLKKLSKKLLVIRKEIEEIMVEINGYQQEHTPNTGYSNLTPYIDAANANKEGTSQYRMSQCKYTKHAYTY